MGNLGPTEILLILVVIVLLFGAKKLPDLARSVGRSMRIFKSEVQEMANDDAKASAAQPAQLPPATPAPGAYVDPNTVVNPSADPTLPGQTGLQR